MLHYTGMRSGEEAVARLCDPAAEVSSHYVVHEDGRIVQLVAESRRAWHAGVSAWRGVQNLNDVSIGIEIVNPGHAHGLRPFPDRQMAAVVELARDLMARHAIAPAWIVAHSDVAPERKLDPGERFDWRRLALADLGRIPEPAPPCTPDLAAAARLLTAVGYALPRADRPSPRVIAAFQRRFRPGRVDGRLDASTMGLLWAAAALLAAPT